MIIYLHTLKQMIMYFNTVRIEIFIILFSMVQNLHLSINSFSKLKITHRFQFAANATDCHSPLPQSDSVLWIIQNSPVGGQYQFIDLYICD